MKSELLIRMNYVVVFVSLIIFSCVEKNEVKNIQGNWNPIFKKEISEEYLEIFIDENKMYYFTSMGMIPTNDYKIEKGNLLIHDKVSGTFKNKGKVHRSGDILEIVIFDKKLSLIQMKQSPKLEDLINSKTNLKNYRKAFESRLLLWVKNKNL